MRISLLEKREPFVKIFIKTLEQYWSGKFGYKVQVSTNEKELIKKEGKTIVWHGNQFLNFFAQRSTESSIFEVIKKEYSRSIDPIKRPLQKLYLWFATDKRTMPAFAKLKIYVQAKSDLSKDQLILGGNHRLRILLPKEKKSVVILKDGFSDQWINNEIEIRKQYSLACAPKLLDYSEEQKWLEESYVEGVPLNRVADENEFATLSSAALKALNVQLIQPSSKLIQADTYFNSHLEAIRKKIKTVSNLKEDLKVELLNFVVQFEKYISTGNFDFEIEVAKTHGDFQVANVLQTIKGFTIIDWESTKERMAMYDLMTWVFRTRQESDWSNIALEYLEKKNDPFQTFHWPIDSWVTRKEVYFLGFILDELEYRIDESCDDNYFLSGELLPSVLSQLNRIMDKLKTGIS